MEEKKLTVIQREEIKPKALRRKGFVPGIVYNKEVFHKIQIKEKDITDLFEKGITESTLIKITLDNNQEDVVFIKDYQKDLISDKIIHVDFYKITYGQKIKTFIPLELVGTPAGVKEGGVLETFLHEIEIETLPKNLKPSLKIDISLLKINESIHINDLKLEEEDTRVLVEGNLMICHVVSSAKLESQLVDKEEPTTEEVSTNEGKEKNEK